MDDSQSDEEVRTEAGFTKPPMTYRKYNSTTTAKPTAKSTAKSTAKPTAKSTAKSTATSTAKPTTKPAVMKRRKRYYPYESQPYSALYSWTKTDLTYEFIQVGKGSY